jgi:hypothetical protein
LAPDRLFIITAIFVLSPASGIDSPHLPVEASISAPKRKKMPIVAKGKKNGGFVHGSCNQKTV